MANELKQNDDFGQIEVVVTRCPICGDPIDVFDRTRPLKECKNCPAMVHKDCLDAAAATGEEYRCCDNPSWELVDPDILWHPTKGESDFIKPDPVYIDEDTDFVVTHIWWSQDDAD